MTNRIISKIHSFTTQLDYLTDSVNVFEKAKNPSSRRNNGRYIYEILSNPKHCHTHTFHNLHQEVEALQTSDPSVQAIRSVWKAFHDSIRPENSREIQKRFEELSSHFPIDHRLGAFCDTDLVIYPDDTPSELLPATGNGIEESEFIVAQDLYDTFIKNTAIIGEADLDFQNLVRRDLRMILSRPLGRELIRLINEKQPVRLLIMKSTDPNQWVKYIMDGIRLYSIQYTTHDLMLFLMLSENSKQAAISPSFILLAHELIHLYLELYDIAQDKAIDPQLNPFMFSDKNEQLTITGQTPSGDITNPISENSLRAQFGLPERYGHKGFDFNTSLENRIGCVMAAGSIIDLEEIFRSEQVTPKLLNSVLQIILNNNPSLSSIDPSYIERLIEASTQNPHFQLEQSPYRPFQHPVSQSTFSSGAPHFPTLSSIPTPHQLNRPHLNISQSPNGYHPANCLGCPDPSHNIPSLPMFPMPQPSNPFASPSFFPPMVSPAQSGPFTSPSHGFSPYPQPIPQAPIPSYAHPANCTGCPDISHRFPALTASTAPQSIHPFPIPSLTSQPFSPLQTGSFIPLPHGLTLFSQLMPPAPTPYSAHPANCPGCPDLSHQRSTSTSNPFNNPNSFHRN